MANTDLLAAIQQRNPAQVAVAIGRGAQPNAHDARGYSPFHFALLTADAPTVRALLDSGADRLVSTKLAQARNMGAKTGSHIATVGRTRTRRATGSRTPSSPCAKQWNA